MARKMYYYYPMSHMQLYVAGAIVTLLLGSIGAFMFLRNDSASDIRTWGGGGGLFSWDKPASIDTPPDTSYRGDGVEDLGIVPLPPVATASSGEGESLASDLAELLAQLTQPSTKSEEQDFVPSAYSLIPQGLISIDGSSPQRSPEQAALFEYGNSVGSALRAFADLHTDMPQILKDQAEDRTDPLKVAALKRLADDFTNLGNELALVSPPSSAESTHEALVAAYRNVGAKLKLVPDASGDDAFLAAVNAYNPTAEELSKQLVSLADLLASRNVTFSQSDAGSIFMFTQ